MLRCDFTVPAAGFGANDWYTNQFKPRYHYREEVGGEKRLIWKLLHATEKAFADRSLFHDENESLLKQNDERRVRQNAKSTVIS